jgi:hypothetical protein
MKRRILVSIGLAVLLTQAFGFSQTGRPSTPPDLQGIWTNATVTPLERPKQFEGKEFLTKAEAAEFEKQAVYEANGDRRDGSADADVGRAYNEFWRDRGNVVSTMRSSLIFDPPDGKVPPLLPEAQKRNADIAAARRKLGGPLDGPEGRSLQERCLLTPQAGPPMLPANYNSNYQIVQTANYVAILVEMIHDARIIPLDGSPHVPKNVRSLMGDSRGHWEGKTLVVETTNFSDKTSFRGASENLRVIERFTRTDENTLLYQFTIDDPTTWDRSWTGEYTWPITKERIYEYACHEGNYAMTNILKGARLKEKTEAEAAKKSKQ